MEGQSKCLSEITMTEDTASANLEGFYRPAKDGGFEWHDGISYSKHGVMVVD